MDLLIILKDDSFDYLRFICFRSFFQSVCVLGYCLLPTTIALIICRIILMVEQTLLWFIVRFIITIIGFLWATYGEYIRFSLLRMIVFHWLKTLRIYCYFIVFSFHGVSRRQSAGRTKSVGCISDIFVLFYNFVARDISYYVKKNH